jgi:ABC-type polysaccharide/polyol phosphate export permease
MMTEQGTTSKPVLLGAISFFVLMGLVCIWLLIKGPDPKSSFFLFRSALFHYSVFAFGVFVCGRIIWLGLARYRKLLSGSG